MSKGFKSVLPSGEFITVAEKPKNGMKLVLPDGEILYLDTRFSRGDRKCVVDAIIELWQHHFQKSWENPKTRTCLDILTNYLVLVKDEEDKGKHEKEVLTLKKMQKMVRGDKKVSHFDNLPPDHQALLGLIDGVDSDS